MLWTVENEMFYFRVSDVAMLFCCVVLRRHVAAHKRGDVRTKRTLRLHAETSRHVGQNTPAVQSIQPVR